jgi:hypothetical protein
MGHLGEHKHWVQAGATITALNLGLALANEVGNRCAKALNVAALVALKQCVDHLQRAAFFARSGLEANGQLCDFISHIDAPTSLASALGGLSRRVELDGKACAFERLHEWLFVHDAQCTGDKGAGFCLAGRGHDAIQQ